MKESKTGQNSVWLKTPSANLVRYKPSGKYFARLRVRGKLIRRSLKTTKITVARLRLGDMQKVERQKAGYHRALANGTMIFSDVVAIYRERLKEDVTLKPRSKTYREERLAALLKSWPELKQMDVREIDEPECRRWAARFAAKAAPSNYNNTVGTLKLILDIAVTAGALYDNPASRFIERIKVRAKKPVLPTHEDFLKLVDMIDKSDGGWNHRCADLVRFLAFGGFRKTEAAYVTWGDCDFERGKITVRGHPVTGTKGGEPRDVPMIPDMRHLLERLRSERPLEASKSAVMEVRECQGAIDSACTKLGITRFTHHDLRHLFATRCIESGVDIPTVSRWLGHKDGGALAMKVYGHLRDQHSTAMAQKVTFGKALIPDNVVALPKEKVA